MSVIEDFFAIILDILLIIVKYFIFIILLIGVFLYSNKINPKDQIESLNKDGVEITFIHPDKILPKEEKNCTIKLKLPDKTLNVKDKVEKKIRVEFSSKYKGVSIPKYKIEHRLKYQQGYMEEKIPISCANPDQLPEEFKLEVDIKVWSIHVQENSFEIPDIKHKKSLYRDSLKIESNNSYICIQYKWNSSSKEVKKIKLPSLKNHNISQINLTLNPNWGNIVFDPDQITFDFKQNKMKNEKEISIKTLDGYNPNLIRSDMVLETVYHDFPEKKSIKIEILDIPFYDGFFTNQMFKIFAFIGAVLNFVMLVIAFIDIFK